MRTWPAADAPPTPVAYAVRSASRTLLWAIVAFAVGLLVATAYVQAQRRGCSNATAASDSAAAARYCEPAELQVTR